MVNLVVVNLESTIIRPYQISTSHWIHAVIKNKNDLSVSVVNLLTKVSTLPSLLAISPAIKEI